MNPLNREAGATPAPDDPQDIAMALYSARVIWRAFPYFAWRYGERGRAFGRSDAGYLVTLIDQREDVAKSRVDWLARLLVPRGMPTLLLEVQLESLARAAHKFRRPGGDRLSTLASELREDRLRTLPDPVFHACEDLCRGAARSVPQARGAGVLIAAAVSDRARGLGPHDEPLVQWFRDAVPKNRAWASACAKARAHALEHCRDAGLGL